MSARAEKAVVAVRMRADGKSAEEIASALRVSRSYASSLYNDPTGDVERRRKGSYGRPCIDCGRITTGSNGRDLAPERCYECAPIKTWTAEVVIDAIQRFAAIHGRPPISSEWDNADPLNGYPAKTTVYRSTDTNSSSPFPSWSAALAAAGFPGITSGRRTYKEGTMPQKRTGYVVLHEEDDGRWSIVKQTMDATQVAALNASLNGHEPTGRWLAIPAHWWRPRELRPRTIYDWTEDVEASPVA